MLTAGKGGRLSLASHMADGSPKTKDGGFSGGALGREERTVPSRKNSRFQESNIKRNVEERS